LRENRLAIALYPGSFDPVHNGHLDIIDRACRMYRRVVVGVAKNAEKAPMFPVADRVSMLRAATERAAVEIMSFEGLTVDFAHRLGAAVIVKGLRAVMDFEYELKMAAMNKRLRPDIETVFMMTAPEFAYLSSTLIREVTGFGGSVSGLIPPVVERRLTQKFSRSQRKR
jgi:pantetheine-phosphate adenylyltransferase